MRQRGQPEFGMHFVYRRPASRVPGRLADRHVKAGAGQTGRGDQAVVAAADHDHIALGTAHAAFLFFRSASTSRAAL